MSLQTTCRYCKQAECTPRFALLTYHPGPDASLRDFTRDLNEVLDKLGLISRGYVAIECKIGSDLQKLVFIDKGNDGYSSKSFVVNGNKPESCTYGVCYAAANAAKSLYEKYGTYVIHPGSGNMPAERLLADERLLT